MEKDLAAHLIRALRWAAEALAVALASAVAGAIIVALAGSLIALATGESPAEFVQFLLFWGPLLLVVVFVVTAAAMPLVALPAMILLRALEAETLGAYVAAGAAGGFLLSIPLGWSGSFLVGFLLLICPAYGAISGAFFFLLCRRSRRAPATCL